MYDLDAIETINFEQLATATDRLLLHRGRVPRYRPSTNPTDPESIERTVIVRRRRRPRGRLGASTRLLVSSVVTGLCFALATLAALV